MNVAVITARQRSLGQTEKNLYTCAGQLLLAYPIEAALQARSIAKVYVSTDGDAIAAAAESLEVPVLHRSPEASGDVSHAVVIREVVMRLRERHADLENVAILLGNTVMVDAGLIDHAMDMLRADLSITGVASVWRAADDHPLRALEINTDGLLSVYGGAHRTSGPNRQSYPPAYFYDQGIWAFRWECGLKDEGPNPWTWLGPRVRPILRPWVGGRDVHDELDMELAEWWVRRKGDAHVG